MPYERILIERERNSFNVTVTDPDIAAKNRANNKVDGPSDWNDPDQTYSFETKDAVLKFVESAIDIALPATQDEFASQFDKLAKAAGAEGDE